MLDVEGSIETAWQGRDTPQQKIELILLCMN